jgi:molybdopterin-guanine dinucleotide biosynthesis protein A
VSPITGEGGPVTFAGAVLAGGASTRLGRDKALIEVGGRPLVQRATSALADAGASAVTVVGGDADRLHGLGLDVVPDGWPGRGPLGGILTAFGWSPAPVVVVLACDLPFVTDDVVAAVVGALGELGESSVDAALAETTDLEPLCGAWRVAACEPSMLSAFTAGERAVHRAIATLRVRRVGVDREALTNVNTPADLAAAEARRSGRTA